mmetsp:Transcript_21874/g.60811  ORF Transcript_21874/g.60811 Transcript_21874/m.60811 type:complete len:111 (-) Transcript_21874:2400-2732(-)
MCLRSNAKQESTARAFYCLLDVTRFSSVSRIFTRSRKSDWISSNWVTRFGMITLTTIPSTTKYWCTTTGKRRALGPYSSSTSSSSIIMDRIVVWTELEEIFWSNEQAAVG